MGNIISKEDFIKVINDVQKVNDYGNGLNEFFRKNNVEGWLIQPDCTDTVVNLLHYIFGGKDADEWIGYFCFELDFGRKYHSGRITDADGSDIKMASAEDLYEFLIKN